jgi:hypothetical protein
VVKWQALAARQVGRELELAHVWSWGWAQRDERSNDPDKADAACVWLWSRNPALCDAPSILGKELDPDRTTGQLTLPAGVRCTYGDTDITSASVAAVAKLTRDRDLALTALVVRAIERERTQVPPSEQLAVERRIVASRFGGSGSSYRAALADAGASVVVGRSVVGDELRNRRILSRLGVSAPGPQEIARFRATYAPVLAREVSVQPAPSWLPSGRGVALATSAPAEVFTMALGRRTIRTAEGTFTVQALDEPGALGALPLESARPAIVGELLAQRRDDAYATWTIKMQKSAESRLVCERDRLPELGVASLAAYLPFLSLDEAEAARWFAARR